MNEIVQTDPYLSFVSPQDTCPVVFAIDEDQVLRPDLDPPPHAAFGVIGLDRAVSWVSDERAADVLMRAALRPVRRDMLELRYGRSTVDPLVDRGWLQSPDEICRAFMITTAQIEVTAHCNWSCKCCPVSQHKKPASTMPMSLYERIIQKLSRVDTLRYLTHHFYNEPSLDRYFIERLNVIRGAGMRYRLFTNGSALTEEKISALATSGVLDFIVFNLPRAEPGAFADFTQSQSYEMSFRNLESAIAHGLDVRIAVNGLGEPVLRAVETLRSRYGADGVSVYSSLISDRAATLGDEYSNDVHIAGRLTGCGWPVNHLHIGVDGELFLCCNDYFKRNVFGNVNDGSLQDAMSSDAAIALRRKVFGIVDAEVDFICRRCHDQSADFPLKQFKPIASFSGTYPTIKGYEA